MPNATDYTGSKIRNEPETLDEDMRRGDIVDVLKRLRFDINDQYGLIWLDRPVRDFLIAALTDSRRK